MTKKKTGRTSRNKGSGFERFIAKTISLFWINNPSSIKRVPLSGGYDKSVIVGDLFYPEHPSAFPLCVECKNQEGWEFHQLLTEREECKLNKFWKQCIEDAQRLDKIPWLVFTRNYMKRYLMIEKRYFDSVGDSIVPAFHLGHRTICLYDDFLEKFPQEYIELPNGIQVRRLIF